MRSGCGINRAGASSVTLIRVKGFQIFADRHGRPRCYHRKTRTPIDLNACPLGSEAFFAECQRIADRMRIATPKPGTFGLLVVSYRTSPAFLDLAPRTRANYHAALDYLKPLDGVQLADFDRPYVVKIRDKAALRGRAFANAIKAVLSVVLAWGAERGLLKDNPAIGVKGLRRKRDLPDPNRPWSDQERRAVLQALPAHMRSAVGLMMFTGMGPKDALCLPKSLCRPDGIATRRAKTGEPMFWPVPNPLRKIISEAPVHNALTLCANSNGQPWTLSGFRASWRPIRQHLEEAGEIQPGLTLYGLRHTVAVILREMGADERTIADALGQRTPEMARRYAKGADLAPKMRDVAQKFEAELNKRETRAVKPVPK